MLEIVSHTEFLLRVNRIDSDGLKIGLETPC